jgi:dynein heavy chain, axonemal
LKRANSKVPEEALLMKAMKDSNIPKFLKDDLPLFYAIINDLFPNSTTEIQRDQKMIKVIEDCQINIGLTPSEA